MAIAPASAKSDNPAAPTRPPARSPLWRRPGWWALLPVALATLPVCGVFFPHRVFFVRDLGLLFWGRYLWLRRSLLSGSWPLWDASIGAGQSAVADALHQMFLLPVLALRLVGSEVVGFNLWIAVPFPLAALGTYLFLRSRFSRPAAALGATAFAICGPVISTGNFPNLSWSVAAMPWVFWALDRLLSRRRPAETAALALACACQALSGEPVTFAATMATALVFAVWVGAPAGDSTTAERLRGSALAAGGVAIGVAASALQLVPLAAAVRDSWRILGVGRDAWSLHPLALAEMFSPHLFGDYFQSSGYAAVPWVPPLNSGRDPFFFSIYFGTALVALALFGALVGWRRRWSGFWVAAGAVALAAAFGPHTPFYPFLQAHLPVVGSFRYPVKYLVVMALALAALAAAGWDGLTGSERRAVAPGRFRAARFCGVAFPVLVGAATYALSAACLYFPAPTARVFWRLAAYVGVRDPVAGAAYMLRSLPESSTQVMLLAFGAALFLGVAAAHRREARLARIALYLLVAVELSVAAWGVNPTFDAKYFAQPSWIGATLGDPQSRFYFGGKFEGTLADRDIDGPRSYVRPFELAPNEGRSALSAQLVFVPGAWHAREMISYDLPMLWSRAFDLAVARFARQGREARDRFLWRTGVRYRVLPLGVGGNRPSVAVTYLHDVRLFDWGPVAPRVSVVAGARVVPDVGRQIDELFGASFDQVRTVMLMAPATEVAGRPGPPRAASARIVEEHANDLTVDADVPEGGGYLVLLDTFAPGWSATVDGVAAPILRANALFRAVRLAPGRHRLVFRYLPISFIIGACVSGAAVLAMLALWLVGWRGRRGRDLSPADASR